VVTSIMADASVVNIAVISDQPTPYRLHVLRRLSRELPGVRVHNVFTHSLDRATMPWNLRVEPDLNPIFFDHVSLEGKSALGITAFHQYRLVRDELRGREVRFIVQMGYNDLARLLWIRWAHRAGVPLLLAGDSNIHDERGKPAALRFVKARLLRWAVRRAAGLMPMGSCGRAYFRGYAPRHNKPEFLFPYEPDYELFARPDAQLDSALRARLNLGAGRRRFLYVGRLTAVKRVSDAIDAFVRIAESCPSWDLIVAGDGELRATLEARVPADVRSRVRFIGFLQANETASCMRCCDALVLPSEREPWALVVNEAVAAGMAVIASDVVGAAAELVRPGVNGMLHAPGDVAGLAAAMSATATGGTCDRMRAAGASVLAEWRRKADPVEGVRRALRHFGLVV